MTLKNWPQRIGLPILTLLGMILSYDTYAETVYSDFLQGVPPADESIPAEEMVRGELRLDLLRARLMIETGRETEALQLLDRLLKENPDNRYVLTNLASLYSRVGLWVKADTLYLRLLEIAPSDKEILTARSYLWRDHTPRVRLESYYKDVSDPGGWQEWITDVSGHRFVNDYMRLGAGYSINSVRANSVRHLDGEITPFEGVRHRGEVFIQRDSEGGSIMKGSIFFNDATPGAGVLLRLLDMRGGRTSLFLEYRRPYWDYIEGIVGNGTRSRLGISREHRLGSSLNMQLGTAFELYGIPGSDDVAKSQAVSGAARYALTKRMPLITLGYTLDADYRISIDTRTDSRGIEFNPIPFVSREVHSIDVAITHSLNHLIFDGYAGYFIDRLGSDGAFMRLFFTYTLNNIEIQVSYEHLLNVIATSQTIDRVGGYFIWRF